MAALQTKLSATLRQWLATRPHLHRSWRSGSDSTTACHSGAGRRRHPETAAANGHGPAAADDPLHASPPDCLRQHCQPASGALHRAALRHRRAHGAGRSRRRVIRQILTESVLLSLIGGVAGLAIAYAGSHMMLTLAFPDAQNMPVQASPFARRFGLYVSRVALTGVIFGTAPAWLSSHAQPADALRGVNRSTGDRSSLPQRALIVLQVALSMVLLAGALLMTRSLRNLEHQNFGIATANRYVVSFDPKGVGYTLDRLPALYRQIEDRFAALPGMANVSLVRYIPLGGNNWGSCVIPRAILRRARRSVLRELGSRQHPLSRFHRRAHCAWPQFLQAGHCHLAAGRRSQSGVCETLLSQSGSGRQTFRRGSIPVLRRFEIAGVFADFKMTDPRREPGPALLPSAVSAIQWIQGTRCRRCGKDLHVRQLHHSRFHTGAPGC